jgi:hypothetical protein
MTKITTAKSKGASAEASTPAESTAAAATAAAQAPRFAAAWMGKVRTSIATAIPANRPALLAAGLGFAVGAGLLAAALGAIGVGHLVAAPTPAPAPWSAAAEETRILKQTVTRLDAQVAGLKASVDAASRHANTQRTQGTEREQRSARAQAEMQARLVKIGDAVERLEKRVAAAVATDATGSVAPRYAAAAAGAQPPATAAETPAKPPVAVGWVIRNVMRGRALVANRRGVFEAAPGLFLPDLGRVEAVTRQNGRWVVVTENGIITAMRRPRAAPSQQAD